MQIAAERRLRKLTKKIERREHGASVQEATAETGLTSVFVFGLMAMFAPIVCVACKVMRT